jgi:hypothetical protein
MVRSRIRIPSNGAFIAMNLGSSRYLAILDSLILTLSCLA